MKSGLPVFQFTKLGPRTWVIGCTRICVYSHLCTRTHLPRRADDNDGVADPGDAFPLDPTETKDLDGDVVGNNADDDDDGDGLCPGRFSELCNFF